MENSKVSLAGGDRQGQKGGQGCSRVRKGRGERPWFLGTQKGRGEKGKKENPLGGKSEKRDPEEERTN